MKFDVNGIDKKTGTNRSVVVDVESETDALLTAKSHGIFPTSVKPHVGPEIAASNSRSNFGIIAAMLFSFGILLGGTVSASLYWLCALAIIFLLGAIDWSEIAKQHQMAQKRIRDQQAQIVCPHCQQKGCVTTRPVTRKKGISGGKATAAVLTGGFSVLATGLSRKQAETEANCSNCGSIWHY